MISVNITTPSIQDDGFAITAAEPWIREKVSLLQHYLSAFVVHVAGRVEDLVVVDLYSGNGLYSLGSKKEVFPGSGLMALGLDLPVSKVVLCEKDPEQFKILKIRVNRHFRGKNVVLLEGKPEELLEKFKMYVPQSVGDYKTAVLCIADPFSLDLQFDTIDRLSSLGFSFLVPFTFVLNDRINFKHYLDENRQKVKNFVGGYRDLERLENGCENNGEFYKRLVRIFETNMLANGLNASASVHKLDSGLMEMPAYCIGLFSKQFSTKAIQQDVDAARQIQYKLF